MKHFDTKKVETDVVEELTEDSWCGERGIGHTVQEGDPTETCVVCHHVGRPEGRDYYTKEEIDKRLQGLVDALKAVAPAAEYGCWKDIIGAYESRFLP